MTARPAACTDPHPTLSRKRERESDPIPRPAGGAKEEIRSDPLLRWWRQGRGLIRSLAPMWRQGRGLIRSLAPMWRQREGLIHSRAAGAGDAV